MYVTISNLPYGNCCLISKYLQEQGHWNKRVEERSSRESRCFFFWVQVQTFTLKRIENFDALRKECFVKMHHKINQFGYHINWYFRAFKQGHQKDLNLWLLPNPNYYGRILNWMEEKELHNFNTIWSRSHYGKNHGLYFFKVTVGYKEK